MKKNEITTTNEREYTFKEKVIGWSIGLMAGIGIVVASTMNDNAHEAYQDKNWRELLEVKMKGTDEEIEKAEKEYKIKNFFNSTTHIISSFCLSFGITTIASLIYAAIIGGEDEEE